jgi:excisionase family DNA binding protein
MVGNSNDDSLVLTPNEVRKMLSCSRSVVYHALRTGTIPSIRISPRKIIIPKRRFMEWLNRGGNNLHPQE